MKSPHMTYIYRPTYSEGLKWLLKLDFRGWLGFVLGVRTLEMTFENFIDNIKAGRSLIRWGDGETANLRIKRNWHQQGHPELSTRLYSLLEMVSQEPEILFGLPLKSLENIFVSRRDFFWPNRKQLWSTRALFNQRYYRSILKIPRIDAELFYRDPGLIPLIMKAIDAPRRDVLFISSKPSPTLVKIVPDIDFLKIPEKDAFATVHDIERKTKKWLNNCRRPVILFAGGSVLKAFCATLVGQCQIIDLGSGVRFLEPGERHMDWEKSNN